MGTNTAAPSGLLFARNSISNSPNFSVSIYAIKKGYAQNLGIGDLVITLTGANQGYVGLSTGVESAQLGVFAGITSLPGNNQVGGATGDGYYDQSLQQYVYGLNGSYQSTANPINDIGAKVIDDPFAIFRVQMINGAWTQSLRGQNINFTAGTNGVPNQSGQSVLSVDFNTVNITNVLPFRILGLSGVPGGPQDPTNTNPWLEVRLNTAEQLASAGV